MPACSIRQAVCCLLFSAIVLSETDHNHNNKNATTSFVIDYEKGQFLLDGTPFRYISSTLHYFRIHPDLWRDRLTRVRAAGINAIQFYIPWNWHEPAKGSFQWTRQHNVIRYIQMARDIGFYMFIRLGPFTAAEIEFGGLPWWLLKTNGIRLRTSDPKFLHQVRKWYKVLLPKLVPYLRKNGGPILMVQIENEYGWFNACDHGYMAWLRDEVVGYFGNDTVQYTTDYHNLECGSVPGVFPTIDFGPSKSDDIDHAFEVQRNFTTGPLVNSEFYTGWFNLWGAKVPSSQWTAQDIVESADYMWKEKNASFNFYTMHGGTMTGFYSGSEPPPENAPVTTSYDFFAPISESGDCNEKFTAIRNWIDALPNWPVKPAKQIPKPTRKVAYGKVTMERIGIRLDQLVTLTQKLKPPLHCTTRKYPMTMEQLDWPYGFMIYKTQLQFDGFNLSVPGIKDHGYVILNGTYKGTLVSAFYNFNRHWLPLNGNAGQELVILVENRGRITFQTMNDYKGIITNVTLDGRVVTEWNHCAVSLSEIFAAVETPKRQQQLGRKLEKNSYFNITGSFIPGVYVGYFDASTPADTFFDPTGWGKGQLVVNGHNLGRYWPTVGPQITLFVPGPVIKKHNTLMLLELEQEGNCARPGNCLANFIDYPILRFKNVTYE